ncbi:S8 family serine peptidase [Aeromicrobium sp. CTD01-1L150]|uniref:S8 family peptidase n=1 Tax=Aeromicrobium sp. CTD01-1L150 TaxID=3341830 RepID=UPI0035BFF537
MRRPLLTATVAGAALALVLGSTSAQAEPDGAARIQPFLAQQLDGLTASAPAVAMIHGETTADAQQAVQDAGMREVTRFDRVGVVAAVGTKKQIQQAREADGVTYVEGNQPVEYHQHTSNQATRGAEAAADLTDDQGRALTGEGVSVAVIDSGVDPTHPYLRGATVANLKTVCLPVIEALCHVQRVPNFLDTDTLSVGGHGTHVSGIAVGRPTTLTNGEELQGAAPGASLVSISTGVAVLILGADSALNWVLENHERPCGDGVSADECPPIKVTNNSYGPSGGGAFDPESTTVKLQRALAEEGVVTVWAAGNDGGDGSESLTNPPGQDPTGGIISVASYYDEDTGTRDGQVSSFSSRGDQSDRSTWPDLSAPGEDITSACRPTLPICTTGLDFKNGPGPLDIGTFNTISGTSMAAPHVAGAVAQLFQANPNATPAQVEQALTSTAHKFTDGAGYVGGTSFDKGHGLMDVVAAVEAVR